MPTPTLLSRLLWRTLRTKGATLLEYGLLVALLSMGSIVAITTTGLRVERVYCVTADTIAYYVFDREGPCFEVAQTTPVVEEEDAGEGEGGGTPVDEEDQVFDLTILVHDVELPVGTTGVQALLFEVEGEVNTPFFYQVSRPLAVNMDEHTVSVSANASGVVAIGSNIDEEGRTLPVSLLRRNVQSLGVRVLPSYDTFVDAEGQYDLIIWTRDDRSNARTFSFKVTRAADVLVFDPVLAVEDVIMTRESEGFQRLGFDLSGPMNSRVGISVRRLEGTLFHRDTGAVRFNSPGGSTVIETAAFDQPSPDGVFLPNGVSGLGVQVYPNGGLFEESFGRYEITLWPVPNPSDRRVFTFTVTRPAADLVFEPELLVSDVTLPVRARGRQNVLFELNGEMNSTIAYAVERLSDTNIASHTWAMQRLVAGTVGPVGGTYGNDVLTNVGTMDPKIVSHLGIMLEPTDAPFVEAQGSYRVHLWPEDREDLVRTYTFTVDRPADTVVFEPVFAVADVVLPERTTTRQFLTFDLAGTMNSNVSYTVRRIGGTGVESYTWAAQRTRAGVSSGVQSTTGNDAPSPVVSIDPSTISRLGIAMEPIEDVYAPMEAEYELTLWPEDLTDQARTYRFSVSRPAVELVFNPTLAVANTTLAVEDTGQHQLLFDLGGTFSTDVAYQVRRVDGVGMEAATRVLSQQGTSTPSWIGTINGDGTSSAATIRPSVTDRLGITVQAASDVYTASSATYELRLWSVARTSDIRTYTVRVTRPAKTLQFAPQVAVRTTTIPVRTVAQQDILFNLSGVMDTDMMYRVRRVEHTNLGGSRVDSLWANAQGEVTPVSSLSNSATGSVTGTVQLAPSGVAQLGVRMTPSNNVFVETRAVFEIELWSPRDTADVKTFRFSVVRPADTVRFNPVLAVSTVAFPAGTSGREEVMFDLTGNSNVDMRYSLRRVSAAGLLGSTTVRHKRADGSTTSGSFSNSGNVLVEDNRLFYHDDFTGLGVQFYFDSTMSRNAASGTYEFVIWSSQDSTDRRTFRFTITRPAS